MVYKILKRGFARVTPDGHVSPIDFINHRFIIKSFYNPKRIHNIFR